MSNIVAIILLYLTCELLLTAAFWFMAAIFYKRAGFDARSLAKGILERIFLFVSLLNGYHHALTFFSAIKLATRLKHDDTGENKDRFNDYYLVGNMVSVMAAIGYIWLWNLFTTVA